MQQLLRYTQALFTHMAQNSACNRHHALEARNCAAGCCSTWTGRPADELRITHERIAGMLGVRREGITARAGTAAAAGSSATPRAHAGARQARAGSTQL
jgi:hypothetical protein